MTLLAEAPLVTEPVDDDAQWLRYLAKDAGYTLTTADRARLIRFAADFETLCRYIAKLNRDVSNLLRKDAVVRRINHPSEGRMIEEPDAS